MAPVPRIQVISRSWVKPATPTPFHREHTKLSDWDFVMYTSYIPILLFYTNDNDDPKFMNTDALKDSLSKTLVDFYPLAGRLLDIGNGKDIIDNCDDGVLFVVSFVVLCCQKKLIKKHICRKLNTPKIWKLSDKRAIFLVKWIITKCFLYIFIVPHKTLY